MDLHLRNVAIYNGMSEESTCFKADLFVGPQKVASVKNDGHGGCHSYWWVKPSDRDVVENHARTADLRWEDGRKVTFEKLDFIVWSLLNDMCNNVSGTGPDVTIYP